MTESKQPPIERDEPEGSPQQPDRHFGYIPDPNFTAKFAQSLKGDDELQRLLATERAALLANVTLMRVMAAAYATAGGNMVNAWRIFQVVIDQYVQKKLDGIDFPGPDSWIKPKIREIVVRMLGEAFDDLTGA